MASYQGSARGSSADPRRASVEASEFPMLCETCLGPNPYVRMMKESYGRECKICNRPFAVFRWKPGGSGTRYKKTEICQTCARVKNVCQTCLFDLQYGLPVQVRDQTLASGDRQATIIPRSDVNREYTASMQERAIANGDIDRIYESDAGNRVLAERVARRDPFYERNRTHVCSFFVRGECQRGEYCPYRHEMIEENELSQQNLRDRYYGVNDPVAEKILRGLGNEAGKRFDAPDPPADISMKTLFIGGTGSFVTDKELREHFSPFGGVASVRIITDKGIAFVEMGSRQAAEAAVQALFGRLTISGTKLSVKWARPMKGRDDDAGQTMAPVQGGEEIAPAAALQPTQGLSENPAKDEGGAIAYDKRGNPIGAPMTPSQAAASASAAVSGPAAASGPAGWTPGANYAQIPAPGKTPRSRTARKVSAATSALPPMVYPSQDPNQLGASVGKTPRILPSETRR